MGIGIYQINNLVNQKKYLGSTVADKGFYTRWHIHLSDLRLGKHHSIHLQRAWDKYGKDSFVFEVIEYITRAANMTDQQWKTYVLSKEQYYLDTVLFAHNKDQSLFHQLGYNICRVAGSSIGYQHTKKAKAKMSKAKMGKQPWLGKRHTDEAKKKISEGHKGLLQGEKNPASKLTESQVLEIRILYTTGEWSFNTLAKKFKVSKKTILNIIHCRSWSHI